MQQYQTILALLGLLSPLSYAQESSPEASKQATYEVIDEDTVKVTLPEDVVSDDLDKTLQQLNTVTLAPTSQVPAAPKTETAITPTANKLPSIKMDPIPEKQLNAILSRLEVTTRIAKNHKQAVDYKQFTLKELTDLEARLNQK